MVITYAVIIEGDWTKEPIAYFLFFPDARQFVDTFWPNKGRIVEVKVLLPTVPEGGYIEIKDDGPTRSD